MSPTSTRRTRPARGRRSWTGSATERSCSARTSHRQPAGASCATESSSVSTCNDERQRNTRCITMSVIRPFRIEIPEDQLVDLRRRLQNTRWPDPETPRDWTQGVPLAYMREICAYWADTYDWRATEARLNAFPQFKTTIDGLDIHFLHVRSKHADALPLLMTHGWPGSVVEFHKVIAPLTDPTAHGASAADAFHVICPSLPGYGFSGKPTTTGWGVEKIATVWDTLMTRLGYKRYVAQGG